jgi:hypothetical protein
MNEIEQLIEKINDRFEAVEAELAALLEAMAEAISNCETCRGETFANLLCPPEVEP